MKKFLKVILIIILILFVIAFVLLNLEIWKSSKKLEYVKDYAKKIDEINVSSTANIIALGEATHGNKEFQELKLTVLQNLVKNNNVKSFALEVDYGDGLLINKYVQGNSTLSLDETVNLLHFDIYKTKQIGQLIEWMKEYNKNVTEENRISFYGFDMQNPQSDVKYIIDYSNNIEELKQFDTSNTLQALTKDYIKVSEDETKLSIDKMKEIKTYLDQNKKDDIEYKLAYHAVENVLNCIDYFTNTNMNDYVEFNNKRDICMKENVKFISQMTNGNVMISGHNGHIAYKDVNYTNMGKLLKDEYGEKYYAIGTEYFNTNCNINNGTSRQNYKCNSADILAYQAKYMDNERYYLDFNSIAKDSEMYNLINSVMNNGDLGESYNILMSVLPQSTRRKVNPYKLYDGMIYVYNVTPLEFNK